MPSEGGWKRDRKICRRAPPPEILARRTKSLPYVAFLPKSLPYARFFSSFLQNHYLTRASDVMVASFPLMVASFALIFFLSRLRAVPQAYKRFFWGDKNKPAVFFPRTGRIGAFFRIFRDLQDLHSFAPLRPQNFRKKLVRNFVGMKHFHFHFHSHSSKNR